MIYLLAKYTLLFLLTALLGFVLGFWFSRRKFIDVSESYEDLRKANERSDTTHWDRLWKYLDAIPQPKETDLTRVYEHLDGVAAAVSNLPRPEPISFGSLESRLDSLKESIHNIPVPEKPTDLDLRPLIERLDGLERGIKAIPIPEKPATVDFSPIISRLDRQENLVKAIPMPEKPVPVDLTPVTGKLDNLEQVIRNFPKPVPQRDVDLKPVQSELTALRSAIKELPAGKSHEPIDLTPITSQLGVLQRRVSDMTRPQSVDLAPFDRRLKAIETQLGSLGQRLAKPARAARPTRAAKAPRKTARKEPRILSAALYGTKDNLKLISGVGPKLEKLLNQNGVFYFWQVAEWTPRDIDVIDERLDAFKGRIARDNWVTQAKQLRRQPDAASMPAE